jgi:hypothetical protein
MRRISWFAAVLGGLTLAAAPVYAATLQQDFSSNPAAQGWAVFGDPQLFAWDSTNQDLQVTWDSSRSNSYFYHKLGTVLGRDDDFSLAFDLRVNDAGPTANTNKTGAFELAIALLNFNQATNSGFLRGTGVGSPNLVEFDYFRDAGFGPTIWPTFISSNSVFNYNGSSDYALLGLTPGDWYHVVMAYSASNSTLTATMTQNGLPFGPINPVPLSTNFTDFRVDAFAICSYSDQGDDFDSLLAHGTVDNLVIVTPPPPVSNVVGAFSSGAWQVQFTGRTNWSYTLERTLDLQTWTPAAPALNGSGAPQSLQDNAALAAQVFYRLRAERR